MGVDDEYRAVSTADDTGDHLLEKTAPITRAAYKKRSLFASVAVGALIGAAVMFALSLIFSPSKTISKTTTTAAAAADSAPVAVTATTTVTATTIVPSAQETDKPVAVAGDPDGKPNKVTEHTDPNDTDDIIRDCGGNAEEAREKGCVFDVMMQLWMHPDCYDSKLTERYLARGNWTWWADAEATHNLSLDEMRKGEHPVIFVIQDYHREHCIFAWEKVVRAMRNDRPLIEELISYDHVMHCKMRTLSKVDENVRGVRAPTGYSRCAKYKTWQKSGFPDNKISSVD